MKQVLFSAFLITFASVASSQTIPVSKVPKQLVSALAAAHPGAKAKWEKEKENYEANFSESGKAMSCVLNQQGKIIETEMEIGVSELPPAARDYIKKAYKKGIIKESAKIVRSTGETIFEAEVGKKDLMFDAKGNFLKAVTH